MRKFIIIISTMCLIATAGCNNGEPPKASETSKALESTANIPDEPISPNIVTTQTESNNEVTETSGENDMVKDNNYETPTGFDKKSEAVSYGEMTQVEYYSNTTGATRKCYVYTPPEFDESKTYPVVYLLHGIGGTHSEWLGGNPNEIISNLIASGDAPPLIAVFPNVRAMTNDNLPSDMLGEENLNAFDNFINDLRDDLMPFINENYPISEKREETAIAGLSMGGRESLYIGVSMPEIFGYIGAFSPAPGLLSFPNLNYPGQLTTEEMTIPDEYKDNTFILICNGNQDGVVNDIPSEYHQALSDNEIEHVYYTMDGGHDFNVWKNGLYNFVKNIF